MQNCRLVIFPFQRRYVQYFPSCQISQSCLFSSLLELFINRYTNLSPYSYHTFVANQTNVSLFLILCTACIHTWNISYFSGNPCMYVSFIEHIIEPVDSNFIIVGLLYHQGKYIHTQTENISAWRCMHTYLVASRVTTI